MEELEKLLSRYTKSLAICGIIICIGMMVTGITGNDNAVLYSFIIALRVETILLPYIYCNLFSKTIIQEKEMKKSSLKEATHVIHLRYYRC